MNAELKNRGQQALLALVPNHGDRTALVLRLDNQVKLNQLSQYLSGEILPSGPRRTLFEKELNVRSTWWDEPPVATPESEVA